MKNSFPLSGFGDEFTLSLINAFPAKFVSVFAPSIFPSWIGYLTQLLKGKSLTITALILESVFLPSNTRGAGLFPKEILEQQEVRASDPNFQ
jgi:hypothetical protein